MKRYQILLAVITTVIWISCKGDNASQANQSQEATSIETQSKDIIAYNVLVDPTTDNYDIFITDLEGNEHTNISNNEWLDWVYTSHEDKLYVISDRDTCSRCYFLYETDIKGDQWKKVSKTLVQDSWVDTRNDGKELIIKPVGKANTPFQIIDRQGNMIAEIDPKMDYFNDPCFSTDGRSIVYRGYNGDLNKSNEAELYLYNIDDGSNKKLTEYPKGAKTFGHFQYYASPARWNDKSDVISYSSSFDDQSIIKSVNAEGVNQRKLTQGNVKAVWHDISDDGQWLTFDGKLDFKADSNTTQIFIMNFEKRSTKSITRGSGYKQGPVFVNVR